MIFYRKRTLVLHLITIGLAFIAGCTITLSVINVKSCKTDLDRLHSTVERNVSTSSIFLVVVILSAPKNIGQRNAIRQTWLNLNPKIDESSDNYYVANTIEFDQSGFLQQDTVQQQSASLNLFKKKMSKAIYKPLLKDLNVEVLHYFAIGTENLPFIESNKLTKEHSKHNDLLLLNDLTDSYANLTLKLLNTIESVNNIESFEYLLKTDDDTYVKLDYLLEDLYQYDKSIKRTQSTVNNVKPELYWGYFNGRAMVKSRGQWKEVNFNLCERYLPYALGGGYVLSKNLVHFVAQNRRALSRYVSEDISMGVWLSSLRNVYKKHDIRFDTAYMPRKCQNYHILLHKRTPTNMRDVYRGFLCTFKEANATNIRRPPEYFYDWSTSQTRCCDSLVDQI
ncbi:beta-1,3-galactosyltransferase 6 [Sitodiplosis mosellana]|uniref:beta-1,3-galactosyltransferase 6 n=1 Tax=Sitodiplosis mosellana TaxID=263140 RepID=UPI002444707C|nr:beta-1,3-galactosyltransferase 6 [Sitodiplosis mosellana]